VLFYEFCSTTSLSGEWFEEARRGDAGGVDEVGHIFFRR